MNGKTNRVVWGHDGLEAKEPRSQEVRSFVRIFTTIRRSGVW